MFVKVKFHGFLKKLCPDEYKVDARTPYEAMRMVVGQLQNKLKRPNGHRFSVFVKEAKSKDDMYSSLTSDELNLFPAFTPAGGGGARGMWIALAVIAITVLAVCTAGAGLAAAGVWTASGTITATGWAGAAAGFSAAFSAVATSALVGAIGIVLSTIVTHFTKDKSKPDQNETQQNYAFGIDGNTTKIGTAIPVGYGRYRVYGQLLSLGSESPNGTKSL